MIISKVNKKYLIATLPFEITLAKHLVKSVIPLAMFTFNSKIQILIKNVILKYFLCENTSK